MTANKVGHRYTTPSIYIVQSTVHHSMSFGGTWSDLRGSSYPKIDEISSFSQMEPFTAMLMSNKVGQRYTALSVYILGSLRSL